MENNGLIDLLNISEGEKQLVEKQLEIIMASSHFHSAKRMKRFLEYIVSKTLIGDGKLLKQYTIGVEALGFPDDFDSDSNPAIRIMGGRVRNRLKEFYESTENNEIIIDIPKGNYAPKFSHLNVSNSQFLVENEKINEEVYTSTGFKLALLSYTDTTQGKLSNLLLLQTADTIAEEFSRFISFEFNVFNPFADKSESHGLVKDVDADYVLAFYVQELPNKQYELICRLGKTGSKEILWSKSYNLDSKISVADQHEIKSKIIAAVADVHQGRAHIHWARSLLLNKESIPYKHKALAYYRQYYDHLDLRTFKEAISFCEEGLEKNINDVLINILYSDLCRRDFVYSYDLIDSSIERGIQCAERVTHLRQDSNEAHFILGQLLFSQGEWQRSEAELDLARTISSAQGIIEYGCGHAFCLMGKWKKGLPLVEKAMELSNSYPSWYHLPTFLSLYLQDKYQEALVEAKKIVSPGIAYGPLARCISYGKLGNVAKAAREYTELVKRVPEIKQNARNIIHRMFGNKIFAEKICKGLEAVKNI